MPLSSQVSNPVAFFPVNNNGLAVVLPDVGIGGATFLSGSIIFGIGTQANNQPINVSVFKVNRVGDFTTTYKGASYSGFIDSGSNAIFFTDSSLPICAGGFYCPSDPLQLSATITGIDGTSKAIEFTVQSSTNLSPLTTAARVGGGIADTRIFDWGLPFFFGRTVFIALATASTPVGTGPFWAF